MLKDIQTTLYDIFGFILPGFVMLATIVILFWGLFLPNTALSVPQFSGEAWVAVTVVAYFLGHLCQAVANWMFSRDKPSERILSKGISSALPRDLIIRVEAEVSVISGIPSDQLKPHQVYQICDEFVAQHGQTGDRDVYIYREGFYRGSSVSFVVLALALFVRAIRPNAAVNLGGSTYPLSIWMFLFFIVTIAISARLMYERFIRFGNYRVTQAVLGFLSIRGDKAQAQKPTP